MRPSEISKFHIASKDSLDDSIGDLEAKNTKLKERIREMEDALMPLSLLSSPLLIVKPIKTTAKLKGSSILLTSARRYVERNIRKIMALIKEAWEVSKTLFLLD
jgi:hypothetical protein